jgi:hypothetical protein
VSNGHLQTASTRGEYSMTGLYGESDQRVRSVRRNQDEGGNSYFSPWGYKRSVWLALAHA